MEERRLPDELERRFLEILEGPEAALDQAAAEMCRSHPEHEAQIRWRFQRARELGRELDALAPDDDRAHPEQIGPYRILEVLGEGGMGVVYLAEQREPIRRRVALKLIRLGMDTAQVLVRFEAERQALGIMGHSGIAKVLEAGTSQDGRPYFAMEYVDGVAITDYCDREDLSVRERLDVFFQVCSAVQHAHQKGVIHRDLKPSNVLVTEAEGRPMPKVIDFGLSRAIDRQPADHTLLTRFGMVVGTPEYMSPEQTELSSADIDTRTDIYSLGIILYELLAGSLPFEPSELREVGYAEMQRRIRDVDPPKPSTRVTHHDASVEAARRRSTDATGLAAQLRGDLDWITMRALEKDRTRRYQSASELAADITRHLHHEPVLAGPASFGYRLAKLVRRHRIEAAAAGAVLLALLIGLAVSTVLYVESLAAHREAGARAAEAQQVTGFLLELFEFASPDAAAGGERIPIGLFLERGARRIETELSDQPRVRAQVLAMLGQVYFWLGSYDTARGFFSDAIALRERLAEPDDSELLRWRCGLGYTLNASGRHAEAERVMGETLELARRRFGREHRLVANCTLVLSVALTGQGRTDEGFAVAREALDLHRAISPSPHLDLAAAIEGVAVHLSGAHQYEEARAWFEQGLAMYDRLAPKGHPATIRLLTDLSRCLSALGNASAAGAAIERAHTEAVRILGEAHPYSANVLVERAHFLQRLGRTAEGEPLLREALAIQEGSLGATHPVLARSLNDLGVLLLELGRHREARQVLEQAVEVYRQVQDHDHPHFAICLGNLAEALLHLGEVDHAERVARESLAQRRRLEPEPGFQVAVGLRVLGWILVGRNDLTGADEAVRESIDLLSTTPSYAWERGHAQALLAHLLNRQGDGESAEEAGKKALGWLREGQTRDHPYVALVLYNLGWSCLMQDDRARAERYLSQSIDMYRRLSPDGHPDAAFPLAHLGTVLTPDRTDEAVTHLREALAIQRRTLAPGSFWLLHTTRALAAAHVRLEQFDAAEPLLLEAYESAGRTEREPKPVTDAVRHELVRLYEAWGKPDEALRYQGERDVGRRK